MFQRTVIVVLRCCLAGVLGGSAALLLASLAAHGQLRTAVTPIAAVEVVGAALLLVRSSARLGAWLLVGTLVAAALFHASRRELPPLAFLVYVAALAVVGTDARREQGAR